MKQILDQIMQSTLDIHEKINMLSQLSNILPIGLVIIYDDFFGANDKFYELTGQSVSAFRTIEDYKKYCLEDYILYADFPKLLEKKSSFTRLYPIHSADSREYYVENKTFSTQDSQGTRYYITILSDQSAMNHLSQQYDESNERFHILEDLIPDYIFEYCMSTDTLHFPENWKPDGVNTEYPHARKWLELHEIIHPDDLGFILDAMTSTRIFKEPRIMEFRARFWKKDYSWYRIVYKLARSRHNNTLRVIGKICNVDNEHLLSPNDHSKEGLDPNTGLLIPSYMESCVDHIIREEPADNMCALMLLQLDDFDKLKKETGDLFSHNIERQVADNLRQSFRNTDVVGYSRDGCYAVFLRKVPEHIITIRATQVLNSIQNLEFDSKTPLKLSCSIGIGISPIDGSTYMDLFLKADSAMYLSKARGGNTYSFFNTAVDSRQRSQQ